MKKQLKDEIYQQVELAWGEIPYQYQNKIKLIIMTSIEKAREEIMNSDTIQKEIEEKCLKSYKKALSEFKTEGYRKRIFQFGYNQCKSEVEEILREKPSWYEAELRARLNKLKAKVK